jgi:hypothetical protein
VGDGSTRTAAIDFLRLLFDLVPDGESISGTDVKNDWFFAVRRGPRDGIVRPGELDIGAVAKRDEHGVVGADHIEPSASAR